MSYLTRKELTGLKKVGKNVRVHEKCYFIAPETVILDDDVCIEANCIVFPNVRIGTHTLIEQNSLIDRTLVEYTVYCGNPIRRIRSHYSPELIAASRRFDFYPP